MKVIEAMHRNAAFVQAEMPLTEVAARMRELDIGAVPVGENDRLIGMVTDRDIAIRAVNGRGDLSSLKARDVMSPGIVYCHEDDDLEKALRQMEENGIRRLPVLNSRKRLVGMLGLGDIAHAADLWRAGQTLAAVSAHHP